MTHAMVSNLRSKLSIGGSRIQVMQLEANTQNPRQVQRGACS